MITIQTGLVFDDKKENDYYSKIKRKIISKKNSYKHILYGRYTHTSFVKWNVDEIIEWAKNFSIVVENPIIQSDNNNNQTLMLTVNKNKNKSTMTITTNSTEKQRNLLCVTIYSYLDFIIMKNWIKFHFVMLSTLILSQKRVIFSRNQMKSLIFISLVLFNLNIEIFNRFHRIK